MCNQVRRRPCCTASAALAQSFQICRTSDPSVVRVRIENGTLIAEAVGEGVATLTVTATDSDGLSATLRFAVQAERTARSRWQGWRLILLEPEGSSAQ